MGVADSKAVLATDLVRLRTRPIPDDDTSVWNRLLTLPSSALVRVRTGAWKPAAVGLPFRWLLFLSPRPLPARCWGSCRHRIIAASHL